MLNTAISLPLFLLGDKPVDINKRRDAMKKTARKCFAVFVVLIALVVSISTSYTMQSVPRVPADESERMYLSAIRDDFIDHKENVSLIHSIGMNIVESIDSLFAAQRADTADTELLRGSMMVTRQYDRTILAYKNILNGQYITDPELKLMIARHTALFAGYADAKREWDNQWDIVARPYIYKHGLFSNPDIHNEKAEEKRYSLYRDPEFRTILWDRRMFAYDVTYITPALLESADAIIERINKMLSR
jgi:hypothetical protein